MPLSIFFDALPYSEIISHYRNWFSNMQVSELKPNIAYSSSLHWQLYCNKYPDERGAFVDWVKEPEPRKSIRFFATVLSPLDSIGDLGLYSRKILDRFIFRRNVFANIPYKFRKDFSEKGRYLFWSSQEYTKEPIFNRYMVVSQDEGHISFEDTVSKSRNIIRSGNRNVFIASGFADIIGHKCRRGEIFDARIKPYMDTFHDVISEYIRYNPNEEVIIASDHGMSTVNRYVDIELRKNFGKQSSKTYIAYSDSCIMCVWADNVGLKDEISNYLDSFDCGHLLTDEERTYYKVRNKTFGDLIYILREGNVFKDNWFGKSIRRPSHNGFGMHGFWPELSARDQMACIILINGKHRLKDLYDYQDANRLIYDVMTEEE